MPDETSYSNPRFAMIDGIVATAKKMSALTGQDLDEGRLRQSLQSLNEEQLSGAMSAGLSNFKAMQEEHLPSLMDSVKQALTLALGSKGISPSVANLSIEDVMVITPEVGGLIKLELFMHAGNGRKLINALPQEVTERAFANKGRFDSKPKDTPILDAVADFIKELKETAVQKGMTLKSREGDFVLQAHYILEADNIKEMQSLLDDYIASKRGISEARHDGTLAAFKNPDLPSH